MGLQMVLQVGVPAPNPTLSFPMPNTKSRMEPESRLESQTFERGSITPGEGAVGG